MKVILSENVKGLGSAGDVVNVSPGYGRNFLLPKKKAMLAQEKNIHLMEHTKKVIENRRKRDFTDAKSLSEKLETISITIPKKVAEEEKIFGSVSVLDIEKELKKEGIEIDKNKITIEEPIKALGVYSVSVKLHKDVISKLKVWVVQE